MTPLAAAEAARRILAAVRPQPALRVPLDAALGSVLAETVVAPFDLPPWTNSSMDGYAVRAADVRGATPARPVPLRVVERIAAGAQPTRAIGPGECARIFTGAPLPAGADGVIRQEDTDLGAPVVAIRDDRDAGANLRRAGEELRRGAAALAAGTPLGPAQLGVLATLAVAHPLVHRRPRVGILASGDELAGLEHADEILAGRKIASANTHTLRALVREAGGEPVDLGIAADSVASVRAHLARGRDCDLLLVNGGMSVGEHDHVRDALAEAGGTLDFWRIRMRPGAPVGFGRAPLGDAGDTPWVGLPGNPVSTMVAFELLVRPAIRRMCGHALPFRRARRARVAEPITLGPRLQHFLRAVVTEDADGLVARLTGPQGSSLLGSMARASALLVIPEGRQETPPGAEADVLLLDESRHQAEPAF